MSKELKAEDIEVSVYKKPGQGWNRAVQCCDITHKPTGIKVTSEGERSEHKSRMVAMDMLREKLNTHPQPDNQLSEVKPCPFCGGDDITLATSYNNKFYNAECNACGACTAVHSSEIEVVQAWNTRSSEWVSVKDRLPEFGEKVLTWHQAGEVKAGYYRDNGIHSPFFEMDDAHKSWCVTHWMLPAPPKEEGV